MICLSGHPGESLTPELFPSSASWIDPGPIPEIRLLDAPIGTAAEPDKPAFAEWTTKMSLTDEGRVANVRLAASRIDGARVAPGARLSFNALVGPRTEQNGFRQAPAIFMGEKILDFGGGTCQVSSTLYAAAVVGGMKVVERRPHSRPVPYIMPGLDSTVVMPTPCDGEQGCPDHVDLILENSHPFEVRISATVGVGVSEGMLTVRLVGGELGKTAKVHPSFEWTEDFEIRERIVPWRKPGSRRLKQRGERGRAATVRVVFTAPDGNRETLILKSKYKPVLEIWEVGPALADQGM